VYYRKFLLLHQTYYEEESDNQLLGSILYASADIAVVGRVLDNSAVNISSPSSLGGVFYLSDLTSLSQSSYVAGALGIGSFLPLAQNLIGAISPLLLVSALNNNALNNIGGLIGLMDIGNITPMSALSILGHDRLAGIGNIQPNASNLIGSVVTLSADSRLNNFVLNNIGNYIVLEGITNIISRALSSILGYNRFVNVGYITSDSTITVAGQVQGNGTLTAIGFIGCDAKLAINSNLHLDNICYVLDGCTNNFVGNIQFGLSDHIQSIARNEIGALSETTLKSSLSNNPTVSLAGYDMLTGATNALYNTVVNIRGFAPLINVGQILSDSFIIIGGQVIGESKMSVQNTLEAQSYLNILSNNSLYNIGYIAASLTNPSQFDSIFGPHILYIEQMPSFDPLYIEQQKSYNVYLEALLDVLG
jgi:hypothetical protein